MFNYKIKIIVALILVVLLVVSVVIWQKYPFGVKQYKTIRLGIRAAEGAGSYTGWAAPDETVPEADFYVYALGDESMCLGARCGVGGYFVECLGGWISGYKKITEEYDYGLSEAGVDLTKQTIITIADKSAKIVGIYPGARIKNLPYIMSNHRDLFLENQLKHCLSSMPSMWK
ncbi:hypothetical protein L6252_02620 [Candidatus Parcubacteria bacterium]|nr:hypothetical protein [Candidatus Parcubacteria bacterium]